MNPRTDPTARPPRPPRPRADRLPIIGIGASAGGLEALARFLTHVPANSGLAFVIVQHLDPTHPSLLVELLQRSTAMPVCEINDGLRVAANHVYVIPPDRDLSLSNGVLHLDEPVHPRGHRLPIDGFFRSLADDQGRHAVGVVLSGQGTDGTAGLLAIKEHAGLTAVEDPAAAGCDSMPQNAIDAGLADLIAPPDQLPGRIIAALRQPSRRNRIDLALVDRGESALSAILLQLQQQTGHDFSSYKKTTLYRRIERRMGQRHIDQIDAYVDFMRSNPLEATLLFKELLIGVTRFFRDPETWEQLRSEVIPGLLTARSDGGILRAWLPGCATGEEAYTLAMVFREALELAKPTAQHALQIFATDLNQTAIDRARRGIYPASIATAVGPDRLRRFFNPDAHGHRVGKEIREMVIFAPHNLLADPPFTKLDLLVCRNLMIYLAPDVHETLLPRFHFSLNPAGILMLGSSESVGSATNLFLPIAGHGQLYQRLNTNVHHGPSGLTFATTPVTPLATPSRSPQPMNAKITADLQALADRLLLQRYAPAAVLVNLAGDILHISGKTGRYLEPATGKANWNVLAMAREGLSAALSEAFHDALRQQATVTLTAIQGVAEVDIRTVDISVQPLSEPPSLRGMVMVVFSDVTAPTIPSLADESERAARQSARLKTMEQALQATREELQTAREEMQTSREELTSTNEELQSTNEELTTAAEELRTMNEELVRARSSAESGLARYTDLFDSAPVGYFTLDRSGAIAQANRAAADLLGMEHGRPAGSRLNLFIVEADRPAFSACLERAFASHEAHLCEVALWRESSTPRKVRVSALAADDAHTCRVVVIDVSEIHEAETALKLSEESLRLAVTASRLGTWNWEIAADRLEWSPACKAMFGVAPDAVMSYELFRSTLHPSDREPTDLVIRKALDERADYATEYRVFWPDGSVRWIAARGRGIYNQSGQAVRMVGVTLDITERKASELRDSTRNRTLTALANGASLEDILNVLVRSVEVEHPGALASVLLLDASGTHVLTGAAPNLPAFYNQAVHGAAIGPTAGSCGTAAFTGKRVVVTDIQTDPLWADYKDLAAQAKLAACWSEPIRGSNGRVLGTFALYRAHAHMPGDDEISAITTGAQLAAVAIERKLTEAAITEWKNRYEATINASGQLLYDWDPVTNQVSYGGDVERILGFRVDEMAGGLAHWLELIHPDDRPGFSREIERVIATKTPFSHEYRIHRKDGPWLTVQDDGYFVLDAAGTITRMVGFVADITARKATESALKESEERYRMLWETTTDAVIVIDQQSRIQYANPAVKTVFGYEPETIIGQSMAMLQPERLRAAHRNGIARYLTTGVKKLDWRATQTMGVHRDGREIPIEIAFSHVALDGKHLFAGFLRDISDRVRAETALRESEERYRHIVQTANEGIWTIDAEARTSFVNPKMGQMLGYTVDEMLGRPLTDFMDDEGRIISENNLTRRRQGISEQHDFRFRRKDGADLWTLVATNPILDANGSYVGAMAMITDITERRHLEDELRQAQKMEAVGRLAGGIAHDFNNQLTVILGFGTMALAKTTDPAINKCLTQITNAAERSADLVRQLLTFSRKGQHTVATVDVHRIISEMLDVLGRSLSKLIRLKPSLLAGDALVQGDASLLQSAFLNLSLNARDAMPAGGELHFATSLVDLDAERIARLGGDMTTGRHLLVTVSDTGQGMSDDVLKHLFEPFFSTKAPGQGTGLGLASVYGAIKQHGGGIEVDSTVGQGTTFRVYLPKTVAAASSIAPPTLRPATTQPSATARVLVIDDEELVAAFVTDTLTGLGHSVVRKENGATGLEHFRTHWRSIDLVVLDMNMPTMSGPETFAAMRAINPLVKVLIVSGYSEKGDVEALLAQGAQGFLVKPFRPDALIHLVAQVLAEKPAAP